MNYIVPTSIKAVGSSDSIVSTITLDETVFDLSIRSRLKSRRSQESKEDWVDCSAGDKFSDKREERRSSLGMIHSTMPISMPERKKSTNLIGELLDTAEFLQMKNASFGSNLSQLSPPPLSPGSIKISPKLCSSDRSALMVGSLKGHMEESLLGSLELTLTPKSRRNGIAAMPPRMPRRKESQKQLPLPSKPLKMPMRKSSATNLQNARFDVHLSPKSRFSFPRGMMAANLPRRRTT